jgi:hypothetical protein
MHGTVLGSDPHILARGWRGILFFYEPRYGRDPSMPPTVVDTTWAWRPGRAVLAKQVLDRACWIQHQGVLFATSRLGVWVHFARGPNSCCATLDHILASPPFGPYACRCGQPKLDSELALMQ